MDVLTQEQKVFVVQQLAMHRTPAQVVELMREDFEIAIRWQSIVWYDPTRNKACPTVWSEIFFATRKKWLETISEIPIATQAYRLQQLQDSFDRQLRSKKTKESALQQTLEQAAKEVGGMFTNRRELTGKDGKPLMDPEEYARGLYKKLMDDGKLDREKIVEYILEEYKVPESVLLISDGSH